MKYTITKSLVIIIIGFSTALMAQIGTFPYPNEGDANIDGLIIGDTPNWDLTINSLDWFAPMYEGFNNNNKNRILSNLYLRYDCENEVMYAMVYQATWDGVLIPLVLSPNDAWISIAGISNKVVLGSSGDDGVPPDFQWIDAGYAGTGTVRGYEASFPLPKNSTYSIIAHVNAIKEGNTETSGTVDEGLELNVDCSVLPVELTSFSVSINNALAQLNWETATEVNNYGFEVERTSTSSATETSWSKVGFVEGHGNSNSPKLYTYSDKSAKLSGKYQYRLKQVDIDGTYEYSDEIEVEIGIPSKFEVDQNYPNPFNPSTTISFSIPEKSNVTVQVFNMLGESVNTLVNQELNPGKYNYDFDASKLTSGTYIYRVTAGENVSIKKMILLK